MPQKGKLSAAAIIVMSSIIASRFTGYLRAMLIPFKFGGVNEYTDAYTIAFLLPDLMFNLLAGGAVAAALIPVLSGYIEKNMEKEGWKAVGTFINLSVFAMLAVSTLGIIFAPQILPIIAGDFSAKSIETRMLAIKLTRILFPSVSFLMLAGLSTGVLNSYNRFTAAAFGPTIYNLGCILSIFIFGAPNTASVKRVAIGVMLSAFFYFVFQVISAARNLKFYKFRLYLRHSGLARLFRLAVPSLLSSSIVQINIIISAGFVSGFKSGTYTAYYLANLTWQLPYGIFAQGIGTAILPTLAARLAVGDLKRFRDVLLKGLRSVLFPSIPSAVCLIILGKPIVRAIFQFRANFDEKSVSLTGFILMFFSVALLTQSIVAIMLRAYYANNDTKTPLYIGIGTIVLNYLLCTVFLRYTQLGAAGMALSYSLISAVNCILLLYLFDKKIGSISLNTMNSFFIRVTTASFVMSAVLLYLNSMKIPVYNKILQLAVLALQISIGFLVYFAVTLILRVQESMRLADIAAERGKYAAGILLKASGVRK